MKSGGRGEMKRLAIFVFYDENGIVNEYVEFLLNSIVEVCEKLVIVINDKIQQEYLDKLYQLTNNIYIRQNVGFDGGAYKDVFLNFLDDEMWEYWDEIILFNDTFYGPFIPWKYIFQEFEQENIDFWGLSRWIGGTVKGWDCEVVEHVQAYFIVIRKRIVLDLCFWEFWKNLPYPLTYADAIKNFEVNFSSFFSQKGFKYKTWIDLKHGTHYLKKSEVVYLCHADKLVCELDFPVVKKRLFSFDNYIQVKNIMKYLENNEYFNSDIIWKHQYYLDNYGRIKPFSFKRIDEFYSKHRKVYVYGYGIWGHKIEQYFFIKDWKIAGFVVSEKTESQENIICYFDLHLDEQDGIILALGKKAFDEVYPIVSERYNKEQLLLPYF